MMVFLTYRIIPSATLNTDSWVILLGAPALLCFSHGTVLYFTALQCTLLYSYQHMLSLSKLIPGRLGESAVLLGTKPEAPGTRRDLCCSSPCLYPSPCPCPCAGKTPPAEPPTSRGPPAKAGLEAEGVARGK